MAETVDARQKLQCAFFNLLEKIPMDKITISGLCQEAGVNRQSFYYHFDDIFDLFNSLMTEKLYELVGNQIIPYHWVKGATNILRMMKQNREKLLHIYNSSFRPFAEDWLIHATDEMMLEAIDFTCTEHNLTVSNENRGLVARYYRYLFIGVIIEYIRTGLKDDPEAVAKRCQRLLDWTLESTIRKAMNT